jgi:hypothetical protein
VTDATPPEDIADDGDETSKGARKKPSRWPAVLIGLATIIAIVSVFSVWLRTQLLDTDEWVDLSGELLQEIEIQEALADYLVETVYEETDVVGALEEQLPPDLEGLAAVAAGALRGPLTDGVEKLLASDQVLELWESANRIAHQTLVNVLRDETTEAVSTSGGEIALDLKPIVSEVAQTLGLSGSRVAELPEDAGRIVIFESDELADIQEAVEVFDFLAWLLAVLVVALYALAVYLARGRRMAVLRNVGWSLAAVGLIVLIVQAVAMRRLVDAIVQDPGNASVADVTTTVATGLLRQMAWSAIIYGVLIVLFTSLLGEHRWAVATRRVLAPALNASTGAVVGGTAILILLLFWWSPGRAFEGWTTAIILVALVIGAVATLRAKTQQEFPDTSLDDVTGRSQPEGEEAELPGGN